MGDYVGKRKVSQQQLDVFDCCDDEQVKTDRDDKEDSMVNYDFYEDLTLQN